MVGPERGAILRTQYENVISVDSIKEYFGPLSHDLHGQEGLCPISSRAPASLTAMILYSCFTL